MNLEAEARRILLASLEELNARYEGANCRADLLHRLQDCDERARPRPYNTRGTKWPPPKKDEFAQPPPVTTFEGEFTLRSCPNLVKKSFSQFEIDAAMALAEPLSAEEKDKFISLELWRLREIKTKSGYREDGYNATSRQVDQAIIHNLFTTVETLLPIPCLLMDVSGQEISLTSNPEISDWTLAALGPDGGTVACLLRFLYVTDLDVRDEIQSLAASGIGVSSHRGSAVWSSSRASSPKIVKAKAVIEWVRHQ